jgi:hypothetical protein
MELIQITMSLENAHWDSGYIPAQPAQIEERLRRLNGGGYVNFFCGSVRCKQTNAK